MAGSNATSGFEYRVGQGLLGCPAARAAAALEALVKHWAQLEAYQLQRRTRAPAQGLTTVM